MQCRADRDPGKSTLSPVPYTVLEMPRLSLRAGIVSLLLLLTAFTVPLIAPVRASSLHLPAAIGIVLIGAALAMLVLFAGPDNGSEPDPREPEESLDG